MSTQNHVFYLLRLGLLVLFGCSEPACFDLVYNPVRETCDCPEGTTPNYAEQVCEGPGVRIAWTGVSSEHWPVDDSRVLDGGSDAPIDMLSEAQDAGPADASRPTDTRVFDGDVNAPTPPAPTHLRYPSNGFMTGSLHSEESVASHPLRPKLGWDGVDADFYQVQMTRECRGRFIDCGFLTVDLDRTVPDTSFTPAEMLEVSEEVPVGSRYFWRVRACNGVGTEACSVWTAIRYVDVGRERGDVNGDGYADLVVGTTDQREGRGNVYVFHGEVSGLPSTPSTILGPAGDAPGTAFGNVVFAGDINADGFGDLVVGAPFSSTPSNHEGNVHVFYGGSDGVQAMPNATLDNPINEENALFGLEIAGVGDVDADGYADVAIAAPNHTGAETRSGAVYLFRGSEMGLAPPPVSVSNPRVTRNARFGRSLAGADVNGDGFVDLVIGAASSNGTAYVFFGNLDGVGTDPSVVLDNPIALPSGFGGTVSSIGDLDGDGFADIAIGAASHAGEGATHIYLGSSTGTRSTALLVSSPSMQANADFGSELRSGDINGDGLEDVLVGAHNLDSPTRDTGAFYVFGGPDAMLVNSVDNPTGQVSALFGGSIGVGDYNGDGYDDVAVGAEWQQSPELEEGNVFVFLGTMSGLTTVPALVLDNPRDQLFGHFGQTIAH